MANEFRYQIAEKTYIQKPLVLGQIRQLTKLLEGLVIPSDANTFGLIAILGDRLPKAIAIVLTPEGINLKDKDIEVLAKALEFELSPEQTIEVIENFFDLNPIASLLERLTGVIGKLPEKVNKTGLRSLSASSQKETSLSERTSSGDSPSESASLI